MDTQSELAQEHPHQSTTVDHLPLEIIAYIMELGHMDGCNPMLDPLYWDFGFRDTISLLSHRFRSIALGTPKLWNCLRVYIGRDDEHALLGTSPESFSRGLQRSGAVPLDLLFVCRRTCDEGRDVGDSRRISRLLFPHLSRLRSCDLFIESMTGALPLFDTFQFAEAPALERMAFRSVEEDAEDITDWIDRKGSHPIFSGGTPNMSSLTIVGIILFPPTSPLPRLQAVTFLSITTDTPQYFPAEFRSLLSAMPSLTELELMSPFVVHFEAFSTPNLRSLTLSDLAANELLEGWTAPVLQSLCIGRLCGGIHDALQHIDTTKYPMLESLVLGGDEFTLTWPFVHATDTLKHVSLMDISRQSADHLLHMMTPSPPCLWPRLQSFSIGSASPFAWSAFLLQRVVADRPILRAQIYGRLYVLDDDVAAIERLAREEWVAIGSA
ncbi:hypothetical protein JAAARDRAFT_318809 [Jaapia argillacea MUCL 33604]|uniref:F-box domain-containing protein n=1 Tax=Jaapia argillacea MUCL 33604 TaxID=933084 RepID=A0A067PXP2_9AGAM|nr:hypothetical protein JAAARDRAFT_318809 [Jaapia argillacea MUCL 33604]